MQHFFSRINGHFTFPDFYEWLAANVCPEGPHIVEVGVFCGQSAAFLGVELLRRCFSPRLDLVDKWNEEQVALVRGNLAPIAECIGTMSGDGSLAAAARYVDGSLDAVFIDADHSYESVASDIAAWLPKVRPGGIIAGHDFSPSFPGVMRAVHERFSRFEVWGGTPWKDTGELFPVWCTEKESRR